MARTSRMNETAQGVAPEATNPDAADAAAFHPVIATARDKAGARNAKGSALKESVMVLALDGEVDKTLAEGLRAGLLKTFADVGAVVRDWKPMLVRLAETTAGLKRNPPP